MSRSDTRTTDRRRSENKSRRIIDAASSIRELGRETISAAKISRVIRTTGSTSAPQIQRSGVCGHLSSCSPRGDPQWLSRCGHASSSGNARVGEWRQTCWMSSVIAIALKKLGSP
eukprot:6639970-Pyramimonas_sp.AAC.1